MNDILKQIDNVLHDLGFEVVEINGNKLYHNKNKGSYYRFTFIEAFRAYVIESASNYEEAKNNLFEDGDLFSIDVDEKDFVEKLRADLIKYYC
ncbi:hypothetical protein M972_112765 [Acetivibrio thermocellus AD2]|uniref:Uncharacterized protein n=2 Tax=Acetivibrio thermocellus TaxID=1515 RepID=A3DGX7_ACET2|nr:hypothetical protein [Acetivibrio thermocellus]CDG36516.1 hypothetical protein CTHBC1_1906 [Acetivibrio thermocellus BC1]ABN53206.1 hypothetical protein Cthe_1988 [Acetivibrio thermocellus ATCC 27405]ABN53234.1 hypothetical protein Cthe_2022 [Acetivibrio thermocellus ATCC 27405]ADU75665.1 hypothetical protein Clo1313_2670 [Acetivibrio thermocellus DSM 1313]ALX09663.1 hypothetical protein AD2_02683 [Acetivibrio thermocellus AD2]